jgi:hypothetical protein
MNLRPRVKSARCVSSCHCPGRLDLSWQQGLSRVQAKSVPWQRLILSARSEANVHLSVILSGGAVADGPVA